MQEVVHRLAGGRSPLLWRRFRILLPISVHVLLPKFWNLKNHREGVGELPRFNLHAWLLSLDYGSLGATANHTGFISFDTMH